MNKIYLIVSICLFSVIFVSCGESKSTEEKPGSQQNSSLIWSVKTSNKLNWQEAKDYCRNLTEREQSDWHLPTIEELRDLIQSCPGTITGGSCAVTETCAGGYCLDESCQACSPESDGSYSRLGDTNQLWSATSVSNYDPNAWYVDFSNAGIYQDGKENYRYVRCTRIVKGTERIHDCQELPDKAKWNTDSGIRNEDGDPAITQTWNGSEWLPATTASYNEETSATECRFKCVENYEWDGGACVNAKRSAECTGLPENAAWNTVSSITQTWNDEEWIPATTASYNEEGSDTECRFKCNTNYSWKNSRCAADTRTADCTGLPANAVWNSASSITQTWNGSDWVPANSGTYNTNPSSAECRFKCDANYFWNGSKCVNPCDSGVCGRVANSSGECKASNATKYSCGCKTNYTWNESALTCDADSRTSACQGLPENAVWNTASSITQTWNGSDWVPATEGSFSSSASTNQCVFKCKENYTWKNSQCTADQRTVNCTEIPENAEWNSVSTITQTWSGSAWLPSNTSSYNESPSTDECRFKCKTNYTHWAATSLFPESCDPETKEYVCPDKPANSSWNSVPYYEQTWNGEKWIPKETDTTYNITPSTTECRFKCNENYTWKDSQCKADTKTVNCTEIPENAEWNNGSTVFQTWNGSTWFPSNVSSYSENPDSNECTFKCIEDHFWRQGACISPCDDEPCSDFENAENECKVFAWNRYTCTCRSSYYWSGTKKGCSTDRPALGNICTGQGTGIDSEYGFCVPQNFSIEAAAENENIVVDNNTGLMWQQTVPDETVNRSTAQNYCNNLVYGGYDGWRLPTTHELLTIVDYGKYFPATDTTYFPDTSGSFWAYDANGGTSRGVSFSFGSAETLSSGKVRCVKGEKMPLGTLTSSSVGGDSVVEDSVTGFMWQGTDPSQKTWSEALQYCENLTYAGYRDWRLPNINELASLVSYEQSNPASEFPDMPASYFWSSTFDAYDSTNKAWGINFKNGDLTYKKKLDDWTNFDGSYLVRCVRSE
ncbi:DUF1566 domain-containing protein [bacterium]|nr:DUF1566 domain-containing protein [bacterium]